MKSRMNGAIAGSVSLAAPIFDGPPVGAIVVAGPRERITPERRSRIGALVARAAHSLSRGQAGPG